jgi:tetratricopeptide (TPR) repeat protein
MDGRTLTDLFHEPPSATHRPTWEPEFDDQEKRVQKPRGPVISAELQEAFAQLVACGGLDEPPVSAVDERAARLDRQARDFNLARVYLDGGRPAKAERLLDSLNREVPDEIQFALHLACCRLQLGQPEECRRLVARSFDRPEDRPVAAYFLGRAAILENESEEAVEWFRVAEDLQTENPELYLQIGGSYSLLKRWSDAERLFRYALTIDGESLAAYLGLARVYLEKGDAAEAIASAQTAIALRHDEPTARYFLGIGLARLNRDEEAIRAFQVCLSMHPTIPEARTWLKRLQQRRFRAQIRHRALQVVKAGP